MNEVKLYRVTGRIKKPNFKTSFQREIRAVKAEEAIEEIYKTLGSKHKIKRFFITFDTVEEVVTEK